MNTTLHHLPSIELPDLPSVELPSVDAIDIIDTDAIADRAARSWRWFARSVPFVTDGRRRRFRQLAAVGLVAAAILAVAMMFRRRSRTEPSADGRSAPSNAATDSTAGSTTTDERRPVSAVA